MHMMKILFVALHGIIKGIAFVVFIAGLVLALLGVYEFIHALSHISLPDKSIAASLIAVGMLQSVDIFLLSLVLFVFSVGLLVLFGSRNAEALTALLPSWIKVSSFLQLKIIIWEAILTTLVVSYLAALAQYKLSGKEVSLTSLVIPGAILLLAASLFLIKKHDK